jgi:hypothetical protein
MNHLVRGLLLGARGDLPASSAAYAKAIALGCNDERAWRYQALGRPLANDLAGYRQVCADVVARFGSTPVPELAQEMANVCIFRPDAVADFRPVVAMAQCAWKHSLEDPAVPLQHR